MYIYMKNKVFIMRSYKISLTLAFLIFLSLVFNAFIENLDIAGSNTATFGFDKNNNASTVLYDSLLTQAFNYLTFNNPTMAIKYFKEAHKLSRTPEVYAGLGMSYFRKVQEIVKHSKNKHSQFQVLRAIQNIKSAIKFYEEAVKLDTDDIDYKYNLAKAYVYRGDPGNLQKAVKLFEVLKEKNASYTDIDIEMARIYRTLNRPDKSAEVLRDYMEIGADSSGGLYEMTKLFISQSNFDKASYYYLMALENIAEEDEVPEPFKDIKLLFTPFQKAEYEQSEHKGRYVKGFWRRRDPTPMTPENEHLIEHLRRVGYAETIFEAKSPNDVYDERGEIYIKYGQPDFRYQNPGDYITYPNESWVYEKRFSERGGLLFYDFTNSGFGFKKITDLRQALMRRSMNYNEFIVLYQDRDYIYPEVYQRVWEKYTRDKVGGEFALDTELERIEIMKEFNEKDSPPTIFDYDYGGEKEFNVAFASASFKGNSGNTRIELYYAFPLDEIYFDRPGRGSKIMKTIVDRKIVVRNIDLEYLYVDEMDIEIETEMTYDMKGRVSIGQVNFEMPPTEVEPIANLEFKSEISNSVGLYYYDLKPKDFRGADFMLSDIQFASDIKPTTIFDQFSKNGLRIIPHISEIVHRNIPLFVYFEMYNLKQDRSGDARYSVEYIISRRGVESIDVISAQDSTRIRLPGSLAREKNYIAIKDDHVKRAKNTLEWLSFDLSTLSVGRYVFSVRVYDKESNTASVSKRNFTLKE